MLSERAINSDQNYQKMNIPLNEIFADKNFNSRGQILATDVVELAKDVALRGLIKPITVRPLWDTEEITKRQGFKYFLVAGFRRYTAYKANNAQTIPAIVRDDLTSEFECRDINAVENLQTLSLNFAQEANSIKHYFQAKWTIQDVAKRINKSGGWVQLRYNLLSMPPQVVNAAAAGFIKSTDMVELYKYRDNQTDLLKMAGMLVDKRKAGEKNVRHSIKKKDHANSKKVRQKKEIEDLMELLQELMKKRDPDMMVQAGDLISPYGNALHTKALAWASGNITALELHTYIRDYAAVFGIKYELPAFEITPLDSVQ